MSDINKIPFNRPFIVGKELYYVAQAVQNGQLAGDGGFTKKCNRWFEQKLPTECVMLTHSCTASLELSAILANLEPGDEVIMPSYTFVSTANAFVLRGARPVFVDIRTDTLNMDENLIEAAITKRTRAICPVHYGGVACEMDTINAIAQRHNLLVIEDAAQGVGSTYKGKALGTLGHLGCFSFHETKNLISGEGGAIIVNDPRFRERAEIIREKGTNRAKFFRGEVDKYSWVDVGSSFLPSELIAAFLYSQLENADDITAARLAHHDAYRHALQPLADQGQIILPTVPACCTHNGHMFYIIMESADQRQELIASMKAINIHPVFHYVPLHTSPMGQTMGYCAGDLPITEDLSDRLLRLPCYYDLSPDDLARVVAAVFDFFNK